MVEGNWTGTMNLTEPQAGSDLALVKSKAVRQRDERLGDHYRISGQKIFITYGEHDLAENIVHLVLARTPDAPEGVKGISLFVVPKFLVNADGSLGKRNDVHCASIEHKLGIHASPTAVLIYGEKEGAIGYLVGEENKRPRLHVHHDERGALRRRPGGRRHIRARLPAGARLCQGARAGARSRRRRQGRYPSSASPTCGAC